MAVTTWTAIHDIIKTQINAISPTSYANVKFGKDRGEGDFRDQMNENAPTQARRYAIVHLHEYDEVQVSDRVAKMEPQHCEVVVAYPNAWPQNDRDLLDRIIDEDRRAIDKVIGMDSTAYPNSVMLDERFSVEREEQVTFLTLGYTAHYHRSV